MKGHTTLPQVPQWDLNHQMQFSVKPGHPIFKGTYAMRGIQSAYFKLDNRLMYLHKTIVIYQYLINNQESVIDFTNIFVLF